MNSLRARLLLAATIVLLAFVALTGYALQRAFDERAERAESDKLQGLIYALLGATDTDARGFLRVNEGELRDDRLARPDSGLYALILNSRGEVIWQSDSLIDPIHAGTSPSAGQWLFWQTTNEGGAALYAMSFTVRWAGSGDSVRQYTFVAAEDTAELLAQQASFRNVLWLWLLVPAVILLVLQAIILQWGMAPLRRVVAQLRGIEGGERHEIAGRFPSELAGLIAALNALLRNERNQQARYRHALDDLAHSLKTPLAVLGGEADRSQLPDEQRKRLHEQVTRMQQIVGYQLQKAAAAGSRTLTAPIAVRPLADKVVAALTKVYRDKGLNYSVDVPRDLRLRVDEGDLLEMLGNLLDNASKWSHGQVRLQAFIDDREAVLRVDDDGPGFPADHEHLLKRGARADTRVEGQGIGLSVVTEIVAACEGSLGIERSPLGGARVAIRLPAR